VVIASLLVQMQYLGKVKKNIPFLFAQLKLNTKGCTNASKEALWFRRLLEDLGLPQQAPTPLYCENQSAIYFAKNQNFHARTKNISL